MPHAHAHAHGSAAPETRAVTALSVVVTATLLVLKVIVWLASGSVAILASAADSGLDVAASAATFFAVRYAATPADAEHRFGHGKAEAFASLFQGGLVFASAALVGEEAIQHILKPQPVTREGWGIGVMVISILFTVGIVLAQTRALRRSQSVAVSADRTHYLTDLASNAMALLGIAATALTGLTVLDAIGGLLVAVVLLGGAVSVFREASNELMDRELPTEERERIRALALQDFPRAGGARPAHPSGRPNGAHPDARGPSAGPVPGGGAQGRGGG